MGYTYVGDTSLYRLTIPEMARLYEAHRAITERKEADIEAQKRQAEGKPAGGIRRRPPAQPRESDKQALREFEQRHAG